MDAMDTAQVMDMAEVDRLLAVVAAIIARLLERGDQDQRVALIVDQPKQPRGR